MNASYHANNWETFISEYGTHFVYDIIMGGRAVQEVSYSSESVSKLLTLDIDISTTAKFKFAKFFADTSVDWKKHEEEINYVEMTESTSTELYIGGHPPRDGNIKTWSNNVVTSPMPIKYSLMEIEDVFAKVKNADVKANLDKVKSSFTAGIKAYCTKKGCKKPIPDLPKPGNAKVEVSKAQAVGN